MKTINALFVLLFSLGTAAQAQAQPTFTISTVAGSAPQINVPATSAVLGAPIGVAVDSSGNLFFAAQDVVMRVDGKTGTLTVVAGNGTEGFSGSNGPATSAQLNRPNGVAVDSTGNIYVADQGNNRVVKIANGVITTVAGTGTAGFSGDGGAATSAQISNAPGIAIDASGNLYIADEGNARVRKVTNGIITTIVGNGTAGFSGDGGPAISATLSNPTSVAIDAAGNLYVADVGNCRIRKVSGGTITTVAGNGTAGFSGDNGPATGAQLSSDAFSIAIDSSGNLYIADLLNNRIRKVTNGTITTVAGNGTTTYSGDGGPATSAGISSPTGVATDSAGNLYISDYAHSLIRKVSGGTITTVAGNTKYGFEGDGGPATNAQLNVTDGVVLDAAGNVYLSDFWGNRIHKVSGGVITAVAGSQITGAAGDNGPATSAELAGPTGLAVDSSGNLYIAEQYNNRIRKVSNGVITTVAGTGAGGFSGDNGPATSAELFAPTGVAVDSAGNLYIADSSNNRIRKVSSGVITTVAGNGTASYSGDGGPATSAALLHPYGVAVDSTGNLYIADYGNRRVRKVTGGIITTVAGNGGAGFSGDNGAATSAQLNGPTDVAVDSAGNLYVVDQLNVRIRKILNGVITTIAGTGTAGFGGDNGPATSAELDNPFGVAVDSMGNVYIADGRNSRIRLLTPSASPTCTFSLNPTSLQSSTVGGNFSVAIQTTAGCSWTVSGLPNWITVSGASSGSGPATVTLVVASNASTSALNASISIAGVSLSITEAAAGQSAGPSITGAGVTNAASFQTGIAPGGILTIFGTNLGASAGQTLTATGSPWPQQLGGTSVTINGTTAPVYYVLNLNGQEQLSVQAPWSLAGASSATVSVTTATGTSPSVTVPVLSAQPGIFILDSASSGATHVNGTVAGASNPAAPGEVVVLYLTGLGAVTNQPATGTSASLTTLSPTVVTPQVMIGGVAASVAFSGLAPGFIGTYQINVTVPTGVSGLVNLTVQANGVMSNTAKIAVQ